MINRTWGYRDGRGLSFTGDVVPASTTLLSYQLGNGGVFTAPEISLQSQLIVDPVLDTAKLVIRDLPADLATERQIKFIIRSNQGDHPIMREVVYDWATILGL